MSTETNTQRDELARLISSRHTMGAVDAILAAGYRKPRTITTVEELDALPVGSVVLAHWADGSQSDYQVTRCPDGSGAASSRFSIAGGAIWLGMAEWGAELTVLYTPEAAE